MYGGLSLFWPPCKCHFLMGLWCLMFFTYLKACQNWTWSPLRGRGSWVSHISPPQRFLHWTVNYPMRSPLSWSLICPEPSSYHFSFSPPAINPCELRPFRGWQGHGLNNPTVKRCVYQVLVNLSRVDNLTIFIRGNRIDFPCYNTIEHLNTVHVNLSPLTASFLKWKITSAGECRSRKRRVKTPSRSR